ncbi:MAG: 2-phospho-L-lactate guanylyltransferase [Chloroflexota bacterium]
MTLWAVVPVKPLRRGKSRLSSVLSEDERTALNKKLLIHTVDTLTQIPELEQVLVVSRDSEALAIARLHGTRTVLEDSASELNIALTRATAVASTYAASEVLILPADLPNITPEDVKQLVALADTGTSVVIAPDHHRTGTNALLVRPPGIISYSFGENSFPKHMAQIEAKGLKVKVLELPCLAQDVDYPEDLTFLNGQIDDWLSHDEGDETSGKGYYSEMIANGGVS